jgi:hypothetical protein
MLTTVNDQPRKCFIITNSNPCYKVRPNKQEITNCDKTARFTRSKATVTKSDRINKRLLSVIKPLDRFGRSKATVTKSDRINKRSLSVIKPLDRFSRSKATANIRKVYNMNSCLRASTKVHLMKRWRRLCSLSAIKRCQRIHRLQYPSSLSNLCAHNTEYLWF